jgi:hypothetical protein
MSLSGDDCDAVLARHHPPAGLRRRSGFAAAHGFSLRSRCVELLPGAETRVTCSGRYEGDYPGWSSALVRELAEHAGVTRVEWRDTD